MTARRKATDSRLLGTWKSDRRKTLLEMRRHLKLRRSQIDFFQRLFGHLQHRYTKDRIHSSFRGKRTAVPYSLVATDRYSVVITMPDPFFNGNKIVHINFEGSWYWINIGHAREYFRRVTGAKAAGHMSRGSGGLRRRPA